MAVKQKYVEQVAPGAPLQMLLRALHEGVRRDDGIMDKDQIFMNIVLNLGMCQIPSDPANFKQFVSDLKQIAEGLKKEYNNNELMYSTLKVFYMEISEPNKTLSPAMSIVIQLIDLDVIPMVVKWILNSGYSDRSLERALFTLCNWLTKWTYTPNLGHLVLNLMKGLEERQHYDILMEVTLATVESLFKLLVLADSRPIIGPVVVYMLSKSQARPDAFHKVIRHVGHIIAVLHKENSACSRYYLDQIVKLCLALMDRFPGNNTLYDNLRSTIQPYCPLNYHDTLDCKAWEETGVSEAVQRSSLGKVGLTNLGNTCYMNSVLQALFMTKLFRNEVLLLNENIMPLFSNLQELFVLLQHSQKYSLSPSDILHLARPPGFQLGHQHDSSEFLGYLLDVLHEQEHSAGTSVEASGPHPESNNTIVQQSFGGKTMTVATCNSCGNKSERIDKFRDIPLSFPSSSNDHSVTSLLDYYLQPEKLCGDNQYHCEKCKGLTDGQRQTHIIEAPPRLILTVKHFGYDSVSQQKTKLLHRVKLEDFIQLSNVNYELYAAVVHCGSSVDSGHYYTFAKENDEWFKFNDSFVMKTTAAQLYNLKPPETPYILFYRSQDSEEPDNLHRTRLSHQLQLVLNRDLNELEKEKRARSKRTFNSSRNDKDDPPPPNCGGGGFSDTTNMFVC